MIVKGGMEGRREEEEGGAGEEVRETKKKGIAEEKRTGFPDIGGLFLSSFMGTERKTRALILPSGPPVSRTQPEARSQADGSYTSGLITSNLEISPQSSAEPSLPPSLLRSISNAHAFISSTFFPLRALNFHSPHKVTFCCCGCFSLAR